MMIACSIRWIELKPTRSVRGGIGWMPPLFSAFAENGFQHHVWTINDIQQAKQFKEWGTSSVTTDVSNVVKGADCAL